MGLHQDKDEDASTLEAGVPVVSLSLGDAARFLLGGFRRREPTIAVALGSGDAFVMGGPEPASLPRRGPHPRPRRGRPRSGSEGRISLTFRQFALAPPRGSLRSHELPQSHVLRRGLLPPHER